MIVGFLERTLQCAQTLFLYCFAHKDMKKDPLKRRTLAKLQNFSKNCQNSWKLTKLIQCFLYWHINTFRFQKMWWTHFVGYLAPLRSKSTSQMNQRLGRKYPTKVCIRSSAVSHGRLYRWTENSFPFFLSLKPVEMSKKCFNII